MNDNNEVERLGEIEPETGSNGKRNLLIAGAAVTVTAAVVATVFYGTRDPGGDSAQRGQAQRVALSSVGHPLEVTQAQVSQSLPVAQEALAGTLAAPANPPTGANGGIPPMALTAYRQAEAGAGAEYPNCKVPWWLLAGMGKVASDHGAGTSFDSTGTTLAQIRGTRLDGRTIGTTLVTDTDNGQLDGDTEYDRAMGPLQFLPGMWYLDARDGNGDGLANPDNIYDAPLAAAAVVCEGGDDLSTAEGLTKGLYRYTASADVVKSILTWGAWYKTNVSPAPATTTPSAPRGNAIPRPTTKPVAPAPKPSGGASGPAPSPKAPAVIAPSSTVMPTAVPRPTATRPPSVPRATPTPTNAPVAPSTSPAAPPTSVPTSPTRPSSPSTSTPASPSQTASNSPSASVTTATRTATSTATRTATSTATQTATPTRTVPTSAPTTATPTSATSTTATLTPTSTMTVSPTSTRTVTHTITASPTSTRTATNSTTPTVSPVPTSTSTATRTATVTATATTTQAPTVTASPTTTRPATSVPVSPTTIPVPTTATSTVTITASTTV